MESFRGSRTFKIVRGSFRGSLNRIFRLMLLITLSTTCSFARRSLHLFEATSDQRYKSTVIQTHWTFRIFANFCVQPHSAIQFFVFKLTPHEPLIDRPLKCFLHRPPRQPPAITGSYRSKLLYLDKPATDQSCCTPTLLHNGTAS